jgi:Zn-dependent peptidase ImmA (M78 family)/DNA-binding XRE family transcriptional regulator
MTTTDAQQLGDRIREHRMRRGMSQDQLAAGISVERSAITKIEVGTRKVSALELARIAETLGVRMARFFEEPTPALVSHRSSQGLDTADSQVDEILAELAAEIELTQRLGALTISQPAAWERPATRSESESMAIRARSILNIGQLEPLVDLPRLFAPIGFLLFTRDMGRDVADAGTLLLREGGVAIVNSANKVGRRRLAAAHELGHFLVSDQYTVDYRVSDGHDSIESRFDDFARALLLPATAITKQWAELSASEGTRAAAVILGSRFRVDMSTLARRLLDLDLVDSVAAASVRSTITTQADMIEFDLHVTSDEMAGDTQPARYQKAVLALVREAKISKERAYDLLWGLVDETDLPQPHKREASEIWQFTS